MMALADVVDELKQFYSTPVDSLEMMLRVAVFGTFVGHGVLATLGNRAWLPYLRTVGIGSRAATVLMPIIGVLDILVGE